MIIRAPLFVGALLTLFVSARAAADGFTSGPSPPSSEGFMFRFANRTTDAERRSTH